MFPGNSHQVHLHKVREHRLGRRGKNSSVQGTNGFSRPSHRCREIRERQRTGQLDESKINRNPQCNRPSSQSGRGAHLSAQAGRASFVRSLHSATSTLTSMEAERKGAGEKAPSRPRRRPRRSVRGAEASDVHQRLDDLVLGPAYPEAVNETSGCSTRTSRDFRGKPGQSRMRKPAFSTHSCKPTDAVTGLRRALRLAGPVSGDRRPVLPAAACNGVEYQQLRRHRGHHETGAGRRGHRGPA